MTKEILNSLELPKCDYGFFYDEAGKEHYRLLNYLCKDLKLVYDIGTYRGLSALAMSSAKRVVSYDVENLRDNTLNRKNISYYVGNVLDDDNLFNADLILIDTYHDGDFEEEILDHLFSGEYKGTVILDDIFFNKEMTRLWDSIEIEKEVSELGHYTGTGILKL